MSEANAQNHANFAEVLKMHWDQIEHYGGKKGIRSLELLQSALATPKATFGSQFLNKDLFEMAAAYLFHVVKNHPFIDGNKRTGAVSALVFLALNGVNINADENSFEEMVRGVAEGKIDKASISDFFREHC